MAATLTAFIYPGAQFRLSPSQRLSTRPSLDTSLGNGKREVEIRHSGKVEETIVKLARISGFPDFTVRQPHNKHLSTGLLVVLVVMCWLNINRLLILSKIVFVFQSQIL